MGATASPGEFWDVAAASYERWWVPIVRPVGLALLDRVERERPDWTRRHRDLLDLGTGTGVLAIDAVGRWAHVTATGIDPAPEMIRIAAERARSLDSDRLTRLHWVEAAAEQLPFPDSSFDVAVSAFVHQFFTERARALSEIRRVLVPGGTYAWVTWQGGPVQPFAPDAAARDVFREEGLELRGDSIPPGERPLSAKSAEEELIGAGFANVAARGLPFVHEFELEDYLARLEQRDARETFAEQELADRERLRQRIRERWRTLPDDAFILRRSLVSVLAFKV